MSTRPGAEGPSLAYIEDLPEPQVIPGADNVCPHIRWDYLDVISGDRVPLRCKRHGCAFCVRVNAQIIAYAIGLANPERAIRFSWIAGRRVDVERCPPEKAWRKVQRNMNRIREYIKQQGIVNEWAYHVERNPRDTGYHVHAWQHGDRIPQGQLQELCHRAGAGFPYIERVKHTGPQHYGVKAVTYGLKGTESEHSRSEFVKINGGRLVHATRKYWRNEEGEQCTQLEARAAAVRMVHGIAERKGSWWIVEHGRSLESARAQRLRAPGTHIGRMLV